MTVPLYLPIVDLAPVSMILFGFIFYFYVSLLTNKRGHYFVVISIFF